MVVWLPVPVVPVVPVSLFSVPCMPELGKGGVVVLGLKVRLAGFIPVPGVSVAGFGRVIAESDVVEDPIPGVLLGVFP